MLDALKIAISMFTKLPGKNVEWKEHYGSKALCFLPFCGLLCGAFNAVLLFLLRLAKINLFSASFIMVLSSFVVCGFLHMDGFMDVSDALLSSRDKEGKIKILKDSNVGAFSVISAGLVLIGIFSSYLSLFERIPYLFVILTPFTVRAFCSFVLFEFKPLSQTGILAYFRADKKPFYAFLMAFFAIIPLIALSFISFECTLALSIAELSVYILSSICSKQLGGINGDVIGAGIITGELIALISYALL